MKALFSSVAAWWDGLSLRERRMLAIMGALVLGVVGWLGVVRPLDNWQADQARARVAAERRLTQVETAVIQRGARPAEAVDLQALVASTASAAGVQPTLGMSEGDDGPGLRLAGRAGAGRGAHRGTGRGRERGRDAGRDGRAGVRRLGGRAFRPVGIVRCRLGGRGGAGIAAMISRLALPLVSAAVLAGCASAPRVETQLSAAVPANVTAYRLLEAEAPSEADRAAAEAVRQALSARGWREVDDKAAWRVETAYAVRPQKTGTGPGNEAGAYRASAMAILGRRQAETAPGLLAEAAVAQLDAAD